MAQLTLTGEIIEDRRCCQPEETRLPDLHEDPKWDAMRHRIADLEARLNELSDGKFYGEFAGRGLETYRISKIKHLAKTCSPEFMEVLRESVILHRDFYTGYMGLMDLLDAKQDDSCFNIARMCQWLGLPTSDKGTGVGTRLLLPDCVGLPNRLRCSFCHGAKERMTMWMHDSGVVIYLCFHSCQHFPEPFRDMGLSDNWDRVDPWQDVKRSQPRLRAKAPCESLRL